MSRKREQLFSDFSSISYEEWKAKIEKDLKGKASFRDLFRHTDDGLEIAPFYRKEDVPEDRAIPGEAPYRRGIGMTGNAWEVRQEFSLQQPAEELARKCRMAVEGGAEALVFRGSFFEMDRKALLVILKDLSLDQVALHFKDLEHPLKGYRELLEALQELDVDPRTQQGSLEGDPLGKALMRGEWLEGEEKDMEALSDLLASSLKNAPACRMIGVDGQLIREAGGSVVQQVAYGLSMGNDYVAYLTEQGHSIDDVSASVQFNFTTGPDFFMEIAGLRAFRILWSKVVEQYNPEHECSRAAYITVADPVWNKTIYDPYVNMVRSAIEAMAAVFGNADAITVRPFDHFFRSPDDFSDRIARNTHHLMKEEAHLDKIADPGGGSYYIEQLTDKIAEKAWAVFQETEAAGGFRKVMEKGGVQEAIGRMAAIRRKAVEDNSLVLLGVNKYPNEEEKPEKPVWLDPFRLGRVKAKGGEFPAVLPWRAAEDLEKERLPEEKVGA